ncbi:MAG: hypothetical protein AAFO95_09835 [Cyanobacteria bacterium J06600_6]
MIAESAIASMPTYVLEFNTFILAAPGDSLTIRAKFYRPNPACMTANVSKHSLVAAEQSTVRTIEPTIQQLCCEDL